ncbi:MAG: phosphoglucosamine mutase, partial [Desulfamplus sp.]|nr:phosphoglucosamine mutase [Desulfamplus sp.]
MKKLFGTDGIRGVANKYPMTVEMALHTGVAIAKFVKKQCGSCVIIGRDTRISGYMLESALSAGITSQGVDVLTAGVIPTPAVAFLSSDIKNVGAGIVISASHNPWQDNGIKIFKKGGYKLSDDEEEAIESMIFSVSSANLETEDNNNQRPSETGRIYPVHDSQKRYCEFLKKEGYKNRLKHLADSGGCYENQSGMTDKPTHFKADNPVPFKTDKPLLFKADRPSPLKMVVDCSNGAASSVAPMLFDDPLLFDARFIFNDPDGKNINDKCGSQHTETLSRKVVESGSDIGLAFDGDADRLIAIDETGAVITGDRILAICASHAKDKGTLENNLVVSTVMSNIGLLRALESLGIEHLMTGVGDREVLKVMQESGAVMGGEDSGHMIFSQYHTTGDGLITALRLIEVMTDTGKSLSELASIMKVYPQILMNVEMDASRPDFMAIDSIANEIRAVEAQLGSDGRVLVRYSGTQPLLRVMVEGPEYDKTKECCERICNKIR